MKNLRHLFLRKCYLFFPPSFRYIDSSTWKIDIPTEIRVFSALSISIKMSSILLSQLIARLRGILHFDVLLFSVARSCTLTFDIFFFFFFYSEQWYVASRKWSVPVFFSFLFEKNNLRKLAHSFLIHIDTSDYMSRDKRLRYTNALSDQY